VSVNVETSGFVGRVLGGRWVVGEQLGAGSFGVVHAGVERGTGTSVAVKLLHPQFIHHGETIGRFWTEAEALRRMNHPNVLVLLDAGVAEDGVPYLVTELLTGETLRDLLNREGALPPERAMRLLGPAAHALHHAHLAGIVHRDLKPENIFRVRKDGMGTTKILDFGVAKLLDTQPGKKLSQTGIMIGTMAYSPPEQMQGVGDIDHRADQFGFAALMFEALTGQRPFPQNQPFALFQAVMMGPRPRATDVQPTLPKAVDAVLMRGLDADRERRYRNVEEFYLSLTNALTGVSLTTTFTGGAPQPPTALPAAAPAMAEPSYVGANPAAPAPVVASARFRPIEEEATKGQEQGSAPRDPNTTLTSAQAPRIAPREDFGTTLSEGQHPSSVAMARTAPNPAPPPPNTLAPSTDKDPAPPVFDAPPPRIPMPTSSVPKPLPSAAKPATSSKANLIAIIAIVVLLLIALVIALVFVPK
jgi:serine/threonine-protein kinase